MNTKEDSELKETASVILDSILKKDFPNQLEKWINNKRKQPGFSSSKKLLFPMMYDILVPLVINKIEDFQKTREPELLGQCILLIPELLENFIIRTQVIIWIIEARYMILGAPKNIKTSIERFTEALIPTKLRKSKDIEVSQAKFLKLVYPSLLKEISNEFKSYKKDNNRQKLHQGDRARILKEKVLGDPYKYSEIKETGNLHGKSFNTYIEDLAYHREPNVIALKLLKDFFTVRYGFKIGERKIREQLNI